MKEISTNEFVEMMNRCKHEIMMLREQVNNLKPKAEAYDNLAVVLSLLPQRSQGFSEDIIWRLQKRIEELQAAPINEVAE